MLVKVEEIKLIDFAILKQGETFYYGGGYLMKIGTYKAVDLETGDVRQIDHGTQVKYIELMVVKKPD